MKLSNEHREPIINEFFVLQYAKLRMLELYYNFFDKLCDVKDNKSDKLKLINKALNKRVRQDSGDEFMSKYRSVLDKKINLTTI